MDLQGHKHDASKSRPCNVYEALSMVFLDSARVWLSFHVQDFSFALLYLIFTISVTYDAWQPNGPS